MVNRRLRVAICVFATGIGGAERYARELIAGLRYSNVEPVVLLPAWPGLRSFLRVDDLGIEVVEIPLTEPGRRGRGWGDSSGAGVEANLSLMGRLARRATGTSVRRILATLRIATLRRNGRVLRDHIARLDLDAIHVNNGGYPGASACLAAVLAARDLNIPTRILTVHGVPAARAVSSIEIALDQAVARSTTTFVTVSDFSRRSLVQQRGMPAESVTVVPTGMVPVRPTPRDIARQALHLHPSDRVAVMLAAFRPGKRHLDVIDAVATACDEVDRLMAVFAGDGPLRSGVEGIVRRRSLGHRIHLPGAVEPAIALGAADVVVLASDTEALPLSVLEAMSAGLPVVATDVGGVRELVEHGRTGVLVPVGDVRALARALATVLTDPTKARALGAAGRLRYEHRHTLAGMVERYCELYGANHQ